MAATQAKDEMVIILLTEHLKATLLDWHALVKAFKTTPIPLQLLLTDWPNCINYTDSCGIGAGGVATPGINSIRHTVWQFLE